MTLAPRTWLHLACLWLSLATALGHAVAPVGSPIDPVSGSAFSASTTDVALAPARTAALFKRSIDDSDSAFAFDAGPSLVPAAAGLADPVARRGIPAPRLPDPFPAFSPSKAFRARAPPLA